MSEYSNCTAMMGCTAWARRIVAAPISERPIWRADPSRTQSTMAPTVSSMGTAGSRRAGW